MAAATVAPSPAATPATTSVGSETSITYDLAFSAGLLSKKVTDSSKENKDDILGDGGCPDNVSDPGTLWPLDGQVFGRT